MGIAHHASTRRSFIQSAALGSALATAGVTTHTQAFANESQESMPEVAAQTYDCDICVVGAGAAGLAAAVEAAQAGVKVIVLESQGITGGNINGVEGCFGLGSTMQKERGIDIDPGTVIKMELAASQMRASGPGYVDMVHRSGDNIDWLVENGVQFGGVDVDKGNIEVFHRFPSGHGLADYAEPMTARAQKLGATIMLNTAAYKLVKSEAGAVCGVLATGEEGVVQINANAVIVATGGFAQNAELMAEITTNPWITYGGFDGHDGSGHLMCVEAGARSYRSSTALLVAFDIEGTPGYYAGGLFAFVLGIAAPYAVWVNQNGERFCPEDCATGNAMEMCMPVLQQEVAWCVLDSAMVELYSGGNEAIWEQIEGGIEFGSIVKAETMAELAESAGLPIETFLQTMKEYEGFVAEGADRNYGKDAGTLMSFGAAPYYALRISSGLNSTIGSIYTDRSFRALDNNMQPIPGLYVVGVEGAMLWSNLYTINVSGGCNANNINSGRVAAQDALGRMA